jgi:hypothetical protein
MDYEIIKCERKEVLDNGDVIIWNGQIKNEYDIKSFSKAIINKTGITFEDIVIQPLPGISYSGVIVDSLEYKCLNIQLIIAKTAHTPV